MTRPTKRPTQLLSVAEVAQRLSCSRGHIYNLIADGSLRSVDIHTSSTRPKTRVYADDLEQFIEARTA